MRASFFLDETIMFKVKVVPTKNKRPLMKWKTDYLLLEKDEANMLLKENGEIGVIIGWYEAFGIYVLDFDSPCTVDEAISFINDKLSFDIAEYSVASISSSGNKVHLWLKGTVNLEDINSIGRLPFKDKFVEFFVNSKRYINVNGTYNDHEPVFDLLEKPSLDEEKVE